MAHIDLAVSEASAQQIFNTLRDRFAVSTSDSGSFGPFTASYSAGIRLERGTLDFQSNNTVLIKELDIVYDPLSLTLGIDIPSVTLGGQCIIPSPWGCILRLPTVTFFGGNPDITLPINLGGIITSEVSATCSLRTAYFTDLAGVGKTRWRALADDQSNKWRFFLDPGWVDIDLIDIADTAGNLVDLFIDTIVNTLFGFLPGWARDLIAAVLGPIGDLVRAILDIGDDIDEWLSNLFGVSFGLFDFAAQLVLDYFAAQTPIFEFNDPYPMLPVQQPAGSPPLVPVLIPVLSPGVTVSDTELVISASVGS